MSAMTSKIEVQLLEVETQLTDLTLKNDFKKIIHEDLDLAKSYLKDQNILGVINCLLVVVGKLHSHILAAHCRCDAVEPLLLCIHRLLQILIKCPIGIIGPTGATGASGPKGPEGKPGPKGATGATGPAGKDGAIGGIGPMGPAGSPGPEGPMGATGPIGPAGTTHIINSCTIPVCEFPVEPEEKDEPVKPRYFDGDIHYQFICKPRNPFHS